MAVNGATHKTAGVRDLVNRFALLKSAQCFHLTLIKPSALSRPQRIEIAAKRPARIGGDVIFDFAEKWAGKILQLLFAYSGNAAELDRIRRIISRHFAKRYIGEDDVSGHAAFIGKMATQCAQALKQYFVAFDRTCSCPRALLHDVDLLGQNDRCSASQ